MTADDGLRDAYSRAIASRGAPDRAECVRPEALLALVRREGREADRLATLDHAMACVACREEFELLRAIERAGGEGVRHAVEGIRWRRYASVALAASAVLAVGLGPGRRMWDRDTAPDAMRGGDSASDVVLVAPTAAAAVSVGAPITFTWRPVTGAGRYTVEVLDVDGAVRLNATTTDTTLTIDGRRLPGAGEYRWLVNAQGIDGAATRSAARALRLRPR